MAELSMDRFTDTVINAMGPNTSPRVREVMTALIRHMHDFAREVNLTTEEYLAACDFMVRAGHMSDDKRNEVVLLTDVFGLESLADFITQGADSGDTPSAFDEGTYSAILGPFWRENAPTLPYGASIVQGGPPGESALVQGRILGAGGQADQGCDPQCLATARRTGFTSNRTRTSRNIICAGNSGPMRRAATPFVRCVRSPIPSRSTAPPEIC